jgi:hypothetical protein
MKTDTVRPESAKARRDVIEWLFLLSVAQIVVVGAMLFFAFRSVAR